MNGGIMIMVIECGQPLPAKRLCIKPKHCVNTNKIKYYNLYQTKTTKVNAQTIFRRSLLFRYKYFKIITIM